MGLSERRPNVKSYRPRLRPYGSPREFSERECRISRRRGKVRRVGHGVGKRFPLALTRRLVRAVLAGEMDGLPTLPDPVFGLHVPVACPDVPPHLMQPRQAWTSGDAYDQQARKLAELFRNNFKTYEAQVNAEVRQAGPR